MAGTFKHIDHTADIAFEISGISLEELFETSAMAWLNSVAELSRFNQIETKKVELLSSSKEQLLVDFLNELNFNLFTKKWLCYSLKELRIEATNKKFSLSAILIGGNIDNQIKIKHEIKAVTYHQMNIVNTEKRFSTLLVFDI